MTNASLTKLVTITLTFIIIINANGETSGSGNYKFVTVDENILTDIRKQLLIDHNNKRLKHKDTGCLELDEKLNNVAQNYIKSMVQENGCGLTLTRSPKTLRINITGDGGYSGENLAVKGSSGEDIDQKTIKSYALFATDQ